MKPFIMKPIPCDRNEVALMVKFSLFDPRLARRIRASRSQLNLMAAGLIAPTAAVLKNLWLTPEGDGYLWNPR